jgi:hypothetical protein
MSDLPRWNDRETDPRKRERAEDSQEERSKAFHTRLSSADPPSPPASAGELETAVPWFKKERSESFHQWPPDVSASTGLRNVGTVDVRPNPKSIRPK